MAVLCVDAGTSTVKAVVFDEHGRALDVERRHTVVHRPVPGHSEQDMADVWDAVVATVRQVVARVHRRIDLVAVTAQGDGCWLVDDAGRPTGPAVLWNDARASRIVDRWAEDGVLEKAYRVNGTLGFAGTSAAILSWLRRYDPDRLERSSAALHCGGWLFLNLTDVVAVEESDAVSPFLDVVRGEYSTELIDLFDVPWAESLLPPVRRGADRVEPLSPTAAEELGLPDGVPVVMAPFDIPATAVGIGAVRPGQALTVLGTTLASATVQTSPDTSGVPAGMLLPTGIDGLYLRSMAAMAGAEVVAWGLGMLGLEAPSRLSDLARHAAPGASGLFFQPYLSPAGERAPFRDGDARGSFHGLSLEHGRPELARAMLEGLSLVVRDCLTIDGARPAELRLCGGGATSDFWCQLLADVVGVPTARAEDSELGAKGAYVSALVTTGEEPDVPSAVVRTVRTRDVFHPDPERTTFYDEVHADHCALLEATAPTWAVLAGARARSSEPQSRATHITGRPGLR